MIRGSVTARNEPVVRVRVRGPSGEVVVTATVDTGFSSWLTLPPTMAAALGPPSPFRGRAVLANGEVEYFDLYPAEVEWAGHWRPVVVSAIGDEALLGMRLLANCEVRITARPGGRVRITPLA